MTVIFEHSFNIADGDQMQVGMFTAGGSTIAAHAGTMFRNDRWTVPPSDHVTYLLNTIGGLLQIARRQIAE
ncbi:hypothetical protein ACFLU6_02060 [Acidobacteriota bacterium]